MAVSGDVTFAEDGGQSNIKLHPYLVALVRWCLSSVWSTASLLLHRLITAPLPPITSPGPKPPKPRPASSDHLHPEPRVECEVLHQPTCPTVDVIFVHGLYGSLANTWRQGEWKSKYKVAPKKVPLRRPQSIPDCKNISLEYKSNFNYKNFDRNKDFMEMEEKFYNDIDKMSPNQQLFITENFYNNTLLNQVEIITNFDTQAEFVKDLFEKTNREDKIEEKNEDLSCDCGSECEVGCGCVCDQCYSPCWPRDWIKMDYPGARVISINYTSDPYLWRPIWVKESKRLRLHERADQMMSQLLALGVGERPIIWVGHSKGGLFIKQIYCEAYDAYMRLNGTRNETLDNVNKSQIEFENFINYENESRLESEMRNYEMTEDLNGIKGTENESSDNEEEQTDGQKSTLWSNSAGFMFYSVPHRGSPLADIKTPITARSVELLEICKDCNLVLELQSRWSRAAAGGRRPVVRSLLETCRTLMSVLWLRIVSLDSADPGIGAVCGVSVDHREICKPTSRHCLLYKELMNLMRAALDQYQLRC